MLRYVYPVRKNDQTAGIMWIARSEMSVSGARTSSEAADGEETGTMRIESEAE